MTHDTDLASTTLGRRHAVRQFTRHYLEMVLAMFLGMLLLDPVEGLAFDALGWSEVLSRPDLGALVMATNMTVAMAAWMLYRGHTWVPIAEMSAAMYVPFVVLFVPLWLGAITGETLMAAGHLLMLPAMAVAMILRRDEYIHAHHGAAHAADEPGGAPVRVTA